VGSRKRVTVECSGPQKEARSIDANAPVTLGALQRAREVAADIVAGPLHDVMLFQPIEHLVRVNRGLVADDPHQVVCQSRDHRLIQQRAAIGTAHQRARVLCHARGKLQRRGAKANVSVGTGSDGKLVGILKHDVVLAMPPLPLRFTGREAVAGFFRTLPHAGHDWFHVIPTRANRQQALAVYPREE
jgi:hypothetical protein